MCIYKVRTCFQEIKYIWSIILYQACVIVINQHLVWIQFVVHLKLQFSTGLNITMYQTVFILILHFTLFENAVFGNLSWFYSMFYLISKLKVGQTGMKIICYPKMDIHNLHSTLAYFRPNELHYLAKWNM